MADETRRPYLIGAWKIAPEGRDVAHAVLGTPDNPNEDQRNFLNLIGADDEGNAQIGDPVSYRVELTDTELARFRKARNFRYAELESISGPDYVPVAPGGQAVPTAQTLRYLGAIFRGSEAWHGRDVPVGVVDSGTTAAMRAYMGITLVARANFGSGVPSGGAETFTGQNHGCNVASLAVPANGRLIDCQATEPSTDGTVSMTASAAIAGIRWAADQGAKIINLSYAGFTAGTAWTDLLTYIQNLGVQLYTSTGNNTANSLGVPGTYCTSYSNVHSAIAFAEVLNAKRYDSNYHVSASGCAPGELVLGVNPDGSIISWSGTSAASPLMAQMNAHGATGGTFTPAQVGAALKANTRDTGQLPLYQGGGAYDLRRALIALGAVPNFAIRRNLITNPSGEVDVSGFGTDTAAGPSVPTRQTSGGRVGSCWLSVTSTGAAAMRTLSPPFAVTPGLLYTGSVFVKRSRQESSGTRCSIRWYDSSGSYLGFVDGPAIAMPGVDIWHRCAFFAAIAPANAATARMLTFNGGVVSGDTYGTDGWMVEEKQRMVEPYFDGSFAGYAWDGAAHASTSRTRYERNDCSDPRGLTSAWATTSNDTITPNIDTSAVGMSLPTGVRVLKGATSGNARASAPAKFLDADGVGQIWSATIEGEPAAPQQRCNNPICASNATNWAGFSTGTGYTGGRVTNATSMVATTGYRVTNGSAAGQIVIYADRAAVTAGEVVTGALQVRLSAAGTVTWCMVFRNSSGAELTSNQINGAAISVAANTSTFGRITGTVPAGAVTAEIAIVTSSLAAGANATCTGHRFAAGADSAMEYSMAIRCQVELVFRDASGAQIGGASSTAQTVNVGSSVVCKVAGTAPSGTRRVQATFLAIAVGANSFVYATACRLDQVNDSALPYKDGNTPTWRWESTDQQSTSTPGPVSQQPLWEPDATLPGVLRWAAALIENDVEYAGYGTGGSQRQRNGSGASGGFNNTEVPWPPLYGPAPFGRPARAFPLRVPDAYRRYEVNPHPTIRFADGDEGWFGYAFCLGADMDVVPNDYQVIWQLHGSPGGGSPMVALEARNGNFYLTGGSNRPNPQTLAYDTGATYSYLRNLNVPIIKHRWYHFVAYVGFWSEVTPMGTTPVVGSGRVDAWLNGVKVVDNFVPPCGTNYPRVDMADSDDDGKAYAKSGIYHRETGFRGATIWISDQKFGSGYAAVDPTRVIAPTPALELVGI